MRTILISFLLATVLSSSCRSRYTFTGYSQVNVLYIDSTDELIEYRFKKNSFPWNTRLFYVSDTCNCVEIGDIVKFSGQGDTLIINKQK